MKRTVKGITATTVMLEETTLLQQSTPNNDYIEMQKQNLNAHNEKKQEKTRKTKERTKTLKK